MHNCGLQADTIAQSFIREDFKSGDQALGKLNKRPTMILPY